MFSAQKSYTLNISFYKLYPPHICYFRNSYPPNVMLCHDFGFQSVPSRSENELFTRYWDRRRIS